jgi:hypothetical protein
MSIIPLASGLYRATTRYNGVEFSVIGFSHTDALLGAFKVLNNL